MPLRTGVPHAPISSMVVLVPGDRRLRMASMRRTPCASARAATQRQQGWGHGRYCERWTTGRTAESMASVPCRAAGHTPASARHHGHHTPACHHRHTHAHTHLDEGVGLREERLERVGVGARRAGAIVVVADEVQRSARRVVGRVQEVGVPASVSGNTPWHGECIGAPNRSNAMRCAGAAGRQAG